MNRKESQRGNRIKSVCKDRPEKKAAPAIVMRQVCFSFSGTPLFDHLDFSAKGGKWTCLLGQSGCGKSTLLRIISGSLEKTKGIVQFEGVDSQQRVAAWMAQKDLLLPWLNVEANVLLGARLRGQINDTVRIRAQALIEAAGLGGYEGELPMALSGGMRQRVALLRTLMENRPVILMDEPFSALDALTRLKLQNLAAEMVAEATVLLVTHDPLEALRLGHHIHVMSGQPATIGAAMTPTTLPPRNPSDPDVLALHAELLDRLMGDRA